jgi:hypothetical protein
LVARIVKLASTGVVGVPLMTPVVVLSVRPAGKVPDWTAKVIGSEPVFWIVCE